jgi:hypothetical protein
LAVDKTVLQQDKDFRSHNQQPPHVARPGLKLQAQVPVRGHFFMSRDIVEMMQMLRIDMNSSHKKMQIGGFEWFLSPL